MTPMPHHPYSPNLALSSTFLFPPAEKVLKGKHFADVEEVKQKKAKALKGITINKFKNFLSSEKYILIDILHQMEST